MAIIPGLDSDVFFGSPETPLPDWGELPPDDSDDDGPGDVAGMVGFDPAAAWPDDEGDDDGDDGVEVPSVKPSPLTKSLNTNDSNVAATYDDVGQLVPADTDAGRQVAEWLDNGVPGYRGVERDGAMVEERVTIPVDSPVFGLAVLEEIERRGWRVE